MLGQSSLFNSYLCYLQGQGELSLEFAQKALDQLPAECELGRADAEIYFALARQMIGQKDAAIRILGEKLQSPSRTEGLLSTRLHATAAFVHLIAGDLRKRRWPPYSLSIRQKKAGSPMRSMGHLHRGCCALQVYDLNAADRYLDLVATNRYIHHTMAAVSGMAGLAWAHQAMQRADRADDVLRDIVALTQETRNPQDLTIADSCRARICLMRGDRNRPSDGCRRSTKRPIPLPCCFFWKFLPSPAAGS